ncbi:thiol peroxidase [Chitinimonas taiwanensis]|jgi:thioredoxin-dependent peroxiredoxin|uniref:Thiol peroxidase, atypical 2-Cys peroxiredoxin n=1 Tax=Chitinimonas taiwanensis DSM 18899 TaxID=1121279 RepID=A0A1K2HG61_9NEIS|nr:thiol peroxidase [Chitinimonas taiwanensis]SFZ75669.1 thiol peroxidase, atypical 2-Cys peroxiredoxin [Chitinimonas taiwanensis DSM 18899]
MATVLLNGEPLGVGGRFPRVGDTAHSFMLVDTNLADVPLSKFMGKRKIIAVVPSVDAEIGLKIARRLESIADGFPNSKCFVVSVDTPYALARVANSEGMRKVQLLSTLRGRDFHKDYGVMITDVPLSGMMATALFGLDEDDNVLYSELVQEVNAEPNYQKLAEAMLPAAG